MSGFRGGVHEVFALLVCYPAYVGRFVPTFRDSLSVLSLRVEQSKKRLKTARCILLALFFHLGWDLERHIQVKTRWACSSQLSQQRSCVTANVCYHNQTSVTDLMTQTHFFDFSVASYTTVRNSNNACTALSGNER
jgi:hypothetical protein